MLIEETDRGSRALDQLKAMKVTARCIPLDAAEESGTCIFTGQPSYRCRCIRCYNPTADIQYRPIRSMDHFGNVLNIFQCTDR